MLWVSLLNRLQNLLKMLVILSVRPTATPFPTVLLERLNDDTAVENCSWFGRVVSRHGWVNGSVDGDVRIQNGIDVDGVPE